MDTILIIFLFVVFVGVVVVIYLFASSKEPLWNDHAIDPHFLPEKKAQLMEGSYPQEQWNLISINKQFAQMQEQIYILDKGQEKPSKAESLKGFFSYTAYSIKLIWKEKEILTFALLQWAVIGAGYYLWIHILEWIPSEVWESIKHSTKGSVVDIVFLLWSFLCVGIVAYPLSILSSCMGAVHFINRQGRPSSIAECLRMVLPRVWPVWIFIWIDSWITVMQILKRLPKKRGVRNSVLSEALYFAWKIGTIGILPSLITGRGLVESCRQSVEVVRCKFKEIMKLRIAYSVLCWIVGISAYIGTYSFFYIALNFMPPQAGTNVVIYSIYFWIGFPIFIAVGIIQLFLRPIYIISSCHIYSDYLNEKEEKIMLPTPPSKGISALVAFGVLLFILAVVFLYRDELGVTKLLSVKYQ